MALNVNDPNYITKALIQQYLSGASDTSPVRSWSQGAARLAQGLMGGILAGKDQQDQQDALKMYSSLLSPDTSGSPPVPPPGGRPSPIVSALNPSTAVGTGGGNGFYPTSPTGDGPSNLDMASKDVADSLAATTGQRVSPEAVKQVVHLESGNNPRNVSGSYAGATQIGPKTFSEAGGRLGGMTRQDYLQAPLEQQMLAYPDYLKQYSFGPSMAARGVDLGSMPPDKQFGALMGMQFAPNASNWKDALAGGNTALPVTSTPQAGALGNKSIDQMAGSRYGQLAAALGGGVSPASAEPLAGTNPATVAPPLPPPTNVAQAPPVASQQLAGPPPTPDSIPPAAQPIAQQTPDIKSRIVQLLQSRNPYAQQFGMELAKSAISPALQPPQAMKIQNRDGSESIVFVNPSQMQAYGQGGKPLSSDTISGGTPHPEMAGPEYGSFLQKQDPGRYNLIQGMISGNLSPAQLSRYGTKQVQALLEDAARIEPGFTAANWDARHKMASQLGDMNTAGVGGRIQSLQNSVEHLANTAESAVKQGNYDTGITVLSQGVNKLRGLSTGQSDIVNKTEAQARIYGGERTKFLTGRGGTAEERDYLASKLAGGPAPASMAGTLEGELAQVKDAIQNQETVVRQTMGDQYLKDHPVVGPKHKEAIQRLETAISTLRGNKPEAGASPAPAQAGSFSPPPNWQFSPSRKQYRDPQGNIYDANGQPVK